ncbi:MAG: enoyl-CoA hydratase/isomerase family protein [Variovorax sp.]|nr:MAG: enoyl-CoA hydratase/isomerase family protein [Variovorax sp.]
MPLLHERSGPVVVLTLSRPDGRNAWDEDFNQGLIETLSQLEDDPEVRCVILTGDPAGRAFSAGANLKDERTHRNESPAGFIEGLPKWRRFVSHLLTEFPKPVIAAVNGYAIGIGCIATFCCDIVVASEDAEWRLPQVKLGILPAYGGSVRLARWVGRGHAMRASLGYPIDAREAYRIGLAQWLVPPETLMDKAMEIAQEISALPPLAVRMVKESLNRGQDIPNLADAALCDVYRFMALENTEDAREAHGAWREGRVPQVHGR